MELIVISPKISEDSAKLLANSLMANYENPYETKNRDFTTYNTVIKYGFSKKIKANNVINKHKHTLIAMDKLKTFEALKNSIYIVPYTTDKEVAKTWLDYGVAARSSTTDSNSKGLTYCDTIEEIENTPAILWTKYIEHTHEFRVNIWRNKVVSVYTKYIDKEHFRFKLFQGVEEHPQLVELVNEVYKKIGLDWCGIDILRDYNGSLYLLEVNSAPILFPYTLKKLVNIIKKELNHEKTN